VALGFNQIPTIFASIGPGHDGVGHIPHTADVRRQFDELF